MEKQLMSEDLELISDEQEQSLSSNERPMQRETSVAIPTERKNRKYSLKLKLEAIAYSKEHSIAATAKKYNCDRKRVREWRQNEETLREEIEKSSFRKKKMRSSGGRRKQTSSELNESVLKWIEKVRGTSHCVSHGLIKLQANKIDSQLVSEGKLEAGATEKQPLSEDLDELISDEQEQSSSNNEQPIQEETSIAISTERKNQKYSLQLKLEAITHSKKYSITAAAKRYNCDRKRIREWRQNEESLREEVENSSIRKKKKRSSCGGQKETSELNESVLKWITLSRGTSHCVSHGLIKLQANKIASQLVSEKKLEAGAFDASIKATEKQPLSEDLDKLISDEQKQSLLNNERPMQEETSVAVLTERKNRRYSLQLKLEAIAYSNEHSINATAKRYNCDCKRIREWRQNEETLRKEIENSSIGTKKMRTSGGGRKETSAELNESVLKWIKEARCNNHPASHRLIKLQANKIASQLVSEGKLEDGAFVASTGWLTKFMKRNGLSRRRVATQ